MVIEVERADSENLVVLLVDIDHAGISTPTKAVKANAFDNGFPLYIFTHPILLLFFFAFFWLSSMAN